MSERWCECSPPPKHGFVSVAILPDGEWASFDVCGKCGGMQYTIGIEPEVDQWKADAAEQKAKGLAPLDRPALLRFLWAEHNANEEYDRHLEREEFEKASAEIAKLPGKWAWHEDDPAGDGGCFVHTLPNGTWVRVWHFEGWWFGAAGLDEPTEQWGNVSCNRKPSPAEVLLTLAVKLADKDSQGEERIRREYRRIEKLRESARMVRGMVAPGGEG